MSDRAASDVHLVDRLEVTVVDARVLQKYESVCTC